MEKTGEDAMGLTKDIISDEELKAYLKERIKIKKELDHVTGLQQSYWRKFQGNYEGFTEEDRHIFNLLEGSKLILKDKIARM